MSGCELGSREERWVFFLLLVMVILVYGFVVEVI